jgi:hypothetical protein
MMTILLKIYICWQSLSYVFYSQADLLMEIAALRQQVAALKKENPRPKLSRFDRLFWVWLSRIWKKWKDALIIVTPETVDP